MIQDKIPDLILDQMQDLTVIRSTEKFWRDLNIPGLIQKSNRFFT